MKQMGMLERRIAEWPGVSIHAHRFGGREFRFNRAEVGHIHSGGEVDIPFTRSIHDALLEEGLAEEHRWVPDSGWITFRVRGEEDLAQAIWLMRLSYLRYTLKVAADPRRLLEEEAKELQLSPRFRSLLDRFAAGIASAA
ncbi:MAG: luciferase family protein [Candidatus Acidiferrales bacterium]